MQEFKKQILKNLESNGFPEKSVSFPTEKMYEIADKKSLSLNSVLDQIKSEYQIQVEIGDEKMIFFKQETVSAVDGPESMMKKAQEMMANMDTAELERMKSMFMNMSEEEKEEIMQKGKDIGIV